MTSLSSLAALLIATPLVLASVGCEDKAIGRPCDVQYDGGTLQAVYNGQALECPTRLCLRPARDQGVAASTNTAPYCTAECSNDSDCDGERRAKGATVTMDGKGDRRCSGGFVCGVAFETGPLCCKKICLCKDFLNIPSTGYKRPASCDKSLGVSMCQNL